MARIDPLTGLATPGTGASPADTPPPAPVKKTGPASDIPEDVRNDPQKFYNYVLRQQRSGVKPPRDTMSGPW